MVRLHLIFYKCLFTSVLERKLAIILKPLLALEASAKVVFVVLGILIQEGMPLQRQNLDHKCTYC